MTKNLISRLDKLDRRLNMDSVPEVLIFIDLEDGTYMHDSKIVSRSEYERTPADIVIDIDLKDDDEFIY